MKIDTSFEAVPSEVRTDEYGDAYHTLCVENDAPGEPQANFVIERRFYFNGRPNYMLRYRQ